MRRLDVQLAKWIENEKAPLAKGDIEVRIMNCLPPIFQAYCKIFHPFELAAGELENLKRGAGQEKWEEMTIHRDSNGNLGYYSESENKEVQNILDLHDEDLKVWMAKEREYVKWKWVAEKYNLIYHNEMNPRSFAKKFREIGWPGNLRFPLEGSFPKRQFTALLGLLKKYTHSGNVFVYQRAPNTVWKDNRAEDLVLCRIEELTEYFTGDFKGWMVDENKQWIFLTDTDLSFSMAGGIGSLIEELKYSNLEVLQCSPDTRIDNLSDLLNV